MKLDTSAKKKKGRPKRTWGDEVEEDMQSRGLTGRINEIRKQEI